MNKPVKPYTEYILSCKRYSTIVAVFNKDIKILGVQYYKGTIYGAASGWVIRREFNAQPLFKLQNIMRKIGSYKEICLQ